MYIKKIIIVITLLSLGLLTMSQCTVPRVISKKVNNERIIHFSGYKWLVRDTDDLRYGPGPNLFSKSSENVWVDDQGKLHLTIVNRNGKWYCAEVTLNREVGYGKYIFYLNSSLSTLDDNVVAGLFTYLDDTQEIDIEFSKWSLNDNDNSQFVVQPYENIGNTFRFNTEDSLGNTAHSFEWTKQYILFESKNGQKEEDSPYVNWTYTGDNIPVKSHEKLKVNLWLYQGNAPKNALSQELIIDSIKYIPFD